MLIYSKINCTMILLLLQIGYTSKYRKHRNVTFYMSDRKHLVSMALSSDKGQVQLAIKVGENHCLELIGAGC